MLYNENSESKENKEGKDDNSNAHNFIREFLFNYLENKEMFNSFYGITTNKEKIFNKQFIKENTTNLKEDKQQKLKLVHTPISKDEYLKVYEIIMTKTNTSAAHNAIFKESRTNCSKTQMGYVTGQLSQTSKTSQINALRLNTTVQPQSRVFDFNFNYCNGIAKSYYFLIAMFLIQCKIEEKVLIL